MSDVVDPPRVWTRWLRGGLQLGAFGLWIPALVAWFVMGACSLLPMLGGFALDQTSGVYPPEFSDVLWMVLGVAALFTAVLGGMAASLVLLATHGLGTVLGLSSTLGGRASSRLLGLLAGCTHLVAVAVAVFLSWSYVS